MRYSAKNQKLISWQRDAFNGDLFEGLTIEGETVYSNFFNCQFKELDCYWGLFNIIEFRDSKFVNCTFRGTVFANCKFHGCEFIDCKFTLDNLKSPCEFEESTHEGCTFKNCKGFDAKHT